jgi:hypothetical protein
MRIDNPTIEGALTLPADAGASGSFSGSFTGDGSGLTGITDSPLVAGAGVIKVGNTVSIGQDVATTSSVTFGEVNTDKGSGSFSGSFQGDGSDLTGVAPLAGDNITVTGTTVALDTTITGITSITATTASFVLQTFESSSTIITSGSNIFGDKEADIQQFTGSIKQSGSLSSTGSVEFIGSVSASSTGRFSSLGINTAPSGVAGAILATNDVVAFASSDERLKENLEPIGSAVEKVEQMTGYTYNWIPMEGVHVYGDMKDVGVVAQEVEKVLPELVSDRENGYKAVKYEKLTAVLIQAVKELSDRVKALENN